MNVIKNYFESQMQEAMPSNYAYTLQKSVESRLQAQAAQKHSLKAEILQWVLICLVVSAAWGVYHYLQTWDLTIIIQSFKFSFTSFFVFAVLMTLFYLDQNNGKLKVES